MKRSEAQELRHGLYRVYWKSGGGRSLASVGSDENGRRWLAPTNWLLSDGKILCDWHKTWIHVDRVELIEAG